MRVASLGVSLFIVLAGVIALMNEQPPVRAALAETIEGARPGRSQLGIVGSGSILVWEDRAILTATDRSQPDPGPNSSDILGTDLATGRAFEVTTAPGDQSAPAISGSLVVWHEASAIGDRDIRAKDLATGAEYDVATGPNDQAFAAVHGQTITWIESTPTNQHLMQRDLTSRAAVSIATNAPGTFLRPAVMSAELIVWGEQNTRDYYVLRALDRRTGTIAVVASSGWIGCGPILSPVSASSGPTPSSG
jgi:beta propeller repeat protein